jgi:WD40 repeat protein
VLQKITVSGCNIWKKQILACASDKFAFASTLAVYIYDRKSYQLLKLLNFADTNITAIEWQPVNEKYLAQATIDKKLVIWDLEPEVIKFSMQLFSHIIQIEWNK